jgi:hypothetical protein
MWVFIAGNTWTGTKVGSARRREVCGWRRAANTKGRQVSAWRSTVVATVQNRPTSKLSQMPFDSFASVLAERGAIRTTSAHRRSCRHARGTGSVADKAVVGIRQVELTSMCRIGSPILSQPYGPTRISSAAVKLGGQPTTLARGCDG